MKKTKDIRHIEGKIRFKLPNESYKEFNSAEEALNWFEENYSDHSMYLNEDDKIPDTKGPVIQHGVTPEKLYRVHEKAASQNPANAYDAAKTWIGLNYSLAPMSLGAVSAPVTTTFSIIGDLVGLKTGNKLSDYIYNNPDKEYKLNIDTSVTPRQATRHLFGALGSSFGTTFGLSGTKPYTLSGAESNTTIVPLNWKSVYKESIIPFEEMLLRNKSGFIPSLLLRLENGVYIYRQPRAFLTDSVLTKSLYNMFRKKMIDNHYFPFTYPNMEGEGFVNPMTRTIISDLSDKPVGVYFKGLRPKLGLYDGAILTDDDFVASMMKQGGTIRKFGYDRTIKKT